MNEVTRICKKVNCVVFGTDIMMYKLMNYCVKNKLLFTFTFWQKTNPPPFINNNYLKDVECILCIREKGCKMYGDYHSLSKVYTSSINKKDKALYKHPTVKPIPLLEKYIKNHTKENDVVLDMYMGSGSTGVACKNLNRNFIGIELDGNYFKIAEERMKEKQRVLFH